MDGFKNKKSDTYRSREIFIKFLKTHAIDYKANGDQIEFERGSRYVIILGNSNVVLCDDKNNTLRQGSVFEIMNYFSGSIDVLV